MERCPPPSGRRLIVSPCNNLYRENNGLVAYESSSKKELDMMNMILPIEVLMVKKIIWD